MKHQEVTTALQNLREVSPKRNFKQTIDLIIALRSLDLKKPENQVDIFITLHYPKGKKNSVCAFVGPELLSQAKEIMDECISVDDFPKWTDKKQLKKLAHSYDYFLAQANIMPKVAQTFGKYLGTAGKMPNPKAGQIVPPNANLKSVYSRLQKTVRILAKTQGNIQTMVGKEDSDDKEVADNIMTIYNAVAHALPSENNVRAVYLKLTMGPPVKIGEKPEEEEEKGEEKSKPGPGEEEPAKDTVAAAEKAAEESSAKDVKEETQEAAEESSAEKQAAEKQAPEKDSEEQKKDE
ncbi:50S ribosomal protein L1 [Candidatus Woesearchaeota archaeon]|nr:50S ribosomal protein L1 [Candidatus Woesearchaeota archaeon]